MAHTYTPGLRVTPRTLITKKRILQLPGVVLVKEGEHVTSETIVARAELPGKVHVVNVVNQLGILPEDLKDFMVKREGDKVEREEVLAENKPLISWFKTSVRSPMTGVVETISHTTGQVLLREPPRRLDLAAYVEGRITAVIPRQGVQVETSCAFIQGIFGVGGETWGPLAVVTESPEAALTVEQLTPDLAGMIVLGGAFAGAEALQRAKAVGIKGLIVGGIHDQDLRALLGYDLGVAITGGEKIGLTLILTEGFGHIPMARKTFDLLRTLHGRKASISGATQIRAGVIRPEIIVPLGEEPPHPDPLPPGERGQTNTPRPRFGGEGGGEGEREGMKVGDQVRIIRDPFFGTLGQVVSLPAELTRIPTESLVRVLEIEFSDGRRAVVPRANVEMIEGS